MKFLTQAIFLASGIVLLGMFGACDGTNTYRVKTETIDVDSVNQILLIRDSLVKPILYKNINGLEDLPFHEAKSRFISAILPSILVAKHQIHTTKSKIAILRERKNWSESDSLFYADAKKQYKAQNIDDLMDRLGTLPNSIVLAQAAVETGWGESRFFVQASNLFGIWSFDETESRIPAGKNRDEKTIFLRSYDDMSTSIADYFEVLARHSAYKSLRKKRQQTSNPYLLIPHLKNYSERKVWYTKQLKKVIRQNNLTKYDKYRIDPAYLE